MNCLSGQKSRQKTCTKYLGVLIDEHLIFKDHINFLKQLNRANGILAKLWHHFWYPKISILLSFWCTSTICMSGLGTKQQLHTSHGSKLRKTEIILLSILWLYDWLKWNSWEYSVFLPFLTQIGEIFGPNVLQMWPFLLYLP